ncbi:histidine phosphatase family protein [Sediminicoccus sp. KRV36]|uniref:histidine phosphatase family protein n=1 Tax=Sediminicoccus sp. KRV36 TaxID=3133721 RepID=UPI00200F499E|nr:histidine phosphatase family protein [Sediminicoccus rosea]UPY38699.1 histidine phosphatase family protein [Sediminicoccus rosea]
MRRRVLLGGVFAVPAMAQGHAFLADDALLPLLRAGGLNLYFRHAITDRSQVDTGLRGDRAGQRNLSEAGRQQATRLGQAIRALNIPVAEVLTSEVFRAQDTAELAFGRAQTRVERDLIADDYTPGSPSDDARAVSRRLAQPVVGGNRVMIGHIVPLGMILGRGLAQQEFPEGAAGVFRPGGADWAFLGFFRAEQLIALAGSAR